jgi:cytochrome b involved in lipid metabolism
LIKQWLLHLSLPKGVDTLLRIPPSVLKTHNKRDDAWSAFNGKVYNITPYFSYHPGGEKELMRAAGRDGTKLFSTINFFASILCVS